MKDHTTYALIGCAGLGLAAAGSAWYYFEKSALDNREEIIAHQIRESEETKKDLTAKLNDCFANNPATAECRAVYSSYVVADEKRVELVAAKDQQKELNLGTLLWAGGSGALIALGLVLAFNGFRVAYESKKFEEFCRQMKDCEGGEQ